MSEIKKSLARVFGNQLPQAVAAANQRLAVPPNIGDILLAPGAAFHRAEIVALPEPVVIAPVPVVDDELREDIPPRSSGAIAKLIAAGEDDVARAKRIRNDKIRYQNLCNADAAEVQPAHSIQAVEVQQAVEPPKVEVPQVRTTVKTEPRIITMSETQRVLNFVQSSPAGGTTALEIGGGTCLPRETIQAVIEAGLASGEIIKVEGSLNTARYSVPASSRPVAAPAPVVPARENEQQWNARMRREQAERDKIAHPEPQLRPTVPALEDIKLPEPAKPLTPEEQAEYDLMHKNRRGIRNPNSFLRG